MRYDDASQAGSTGHAETVARPDVDTLPPGSFGPATGNAITGAGTNSGLTGADTVAVAPPKIIAVQGQGGQTVVANGSYQVAGQYGVLSIDADGNFSYVRNAGTPDGVKDVFNYTLADGSGANASTTLTIDIGQVAAAAAGQGVVSLPAGVELSDIHVNGRDLVIHMPDGSQMVIPGGAVFVPEITIGDVQVPPTNLAALLIDSEPQPAAGPPTSSGGDWNDPVPPLDPGVPLGDLVPPTELTATTPTFQEIFPGEHHHPTVVIETPDFPTGVVNASESVFEKGLPARGGEPAGSGEIADGNPSNNSDPSEANTGTIVFTAQGGLQSVTVDGVAVTQVGQTIQGQFGTMTITGINLNSGQITYTYTLADNTSGDTTADHFTVVVTDKSGDTATATLDVKIVDDVPTARNDTDATDANSHTATGNVITGVGTTSGSAGADTLGADNAHLTAIVGAGGTDNSLDSSGNLTIAGQFGTLVINQDGGYTYTENQNAPGNSVDTFTYTLTDGDGDTSTATLTITNPNHVPVAGPNALVQLDDDALAGGNPGGIGDGPDAVNTTGTLSGSGGDGQLTFALATSGAPAGFTYVSGPNGSILVQQVQDGQTVTVLTITVDAHTGAYTVTQNAPIDHAAGGNENNVDFTINYTVTDADGDHANGSLNVQVNDDTPVVSLADVGTPSLTVDETNLGTDDTKSFANSFSVSFGADGPATANALVYTLGISASGADSGLIDTATGNHVFLFLESGVVVGREGTSAADAAGGPVVFTVTVDSAGNVTLDQDRAVVQPNGTNPDTSEGVTLATGNLVTITATATDHDGDSASQTLNLGGQLHFNDDGPTISATAAPPSLTVDETDLSVNATASIAGIFTSSFGADGAGTITYTLGISASGADSGLIDTASGNHVFLFLENGQVVGREGADATAAASGPEVFTVTIDGAGNVTLDQIRAVVQPDGTSPDTSEGVTLSAAGLVTVTGTVTDKDGDSSSATANIGQSLNFDDDGPTISASGTVASVTVTETALNTPESSSFAGAFTIHFGADGPAASNSIGYTLGISSNGVDSGLIDTATGQHIFLVMNGSTVEGHVGSTSGALAFTVTVDASGDVTLDQLRAVVQPNGTNPDTGEGVSPLASTITLTATATDGDGDHASQSINIGDHLVFDDAGPTISAAATQPDLTVDETNLSVNATSSFATVFTSSFGADGAGTITYALGISASGADSGLIDTATGNHVFLFLENGQVVGREGADATAAASGPEVFTVSIDASGNVTLDQIRAVVQPLGTNGDTSEGVTLVTDGLVTVTGTITDKDGDSATATASIGQNLHFNDDGPTANPDTNSTSAGTTLTVTAASASDVLHNDLSGADGFASGGGVVGVATGTNTSTALSTGVGTVIHGTFGDLTLNADGSYTYVAKPNVTGVDHFVYTVADGDGDTSTTTLNITVNAATVTAGTSSTVVSEEVLLAGTEHGGDNDADAARDVLVNSGNISLTDSISGATFTTGLTTPSGTFTSGGTAITWTLSNGNHTLTGTAGATTIIVVTIDNTGHYTVTLSGPIDTPNGGIGENGGDAVLNIGVTATDNFGNTATNGTLTVNVEDDAPTISASLTQPTLTVDETNLAVNATSSFAGVFTSAFGADGAGTLVYALGISASGADSGLVDTASGNHVFLFLESGVVVGREGTTSATAASGPIVFTVSVDSSGNVTLDQVRAVVHADTTNPNDSTTLSSDGLVTLTGTITDRDGDHASATANIGSNLVFQDDGPTISASVTQPTLTVDETNLATNATSSFAGVFTSSFGADGAGTLTYTLGISASGVDSGIIDTASGNHVFLFLESGVVVGREGTTSATAASGPIVFTVSVDSSGNVTLDQVRAVVHADTTNPNDSTTLSLDSLVTLTGTITDKDGDHASATANIGQNLTFLDDGPSISLTGATEPTLTVDETNLAINATGSIAGLFSTSFGADGAGTVTYAMHISASGADSGLVDTASGNHVFLFLEGGVVVGREGTTSATAASGPIVFTVSVDSSGTVTLDQVRAVVHPTPSNPDTDETVTLSADNLISVTATVTDKDGDHVSQSVNLGQNLIFHDDGPTAINPQSIETGDVAQAMIIASLDTDNSVANNFGADGPGSITFANITNGQDSGFTSGGSHITLWLSDNGQTLEGRTGSTNGTDGTLIFTIHIDQANSQYDFTLDAPIDNGSGVSFDNLTSTNAGNVDYRGVGADSTAQPIDLLLSATSGGNVATVNTDATAIGVGNQSLNVGDSVRIDFVSNLTTGTVSGTDPTGFNFTGHDSSNGFIGLIPQVQGQQSNTVSFTVWALNTTLTDTSAPDSNPTGGFSDGTSLTVTSVYVQDYLTGNTATLDISGLATGSTTAVGFGISVTKNADGSVTFSGVQEGDHYGVTTSTDFNAIVVKDVSGSFDLGTFSLSQTAVGHTLNLSYDLQITDGDGDSVSVPGGIAIQLDPNSNTTPVITNTSVIHTQDVGHTALGTSSLIATNDNVEQQGQRVFSVGQTTALMGALAAAGLDAQHLALDSHHVALSVGDQPVLTPLQTASLGSVVAESASTVGASHVTAALTGVTGAAQPVQHGTTAHDMVEAAHPLSGAASAPTVPVTQLLHGSTAAGGHATQAAVGSTTAHSVVMPSAQQLAAAGHGSPHQTSVAADSAQHEQVVSKVLVDALSGGNAHGPSIDTLISGLPNQGAAHGVMQALADHGAVPFGHMAFTTPFGSAHPMLSVEMAMQHAPPAHG